MTKGYFRPNELGFIVNDLLVENFPEVLDVEFTAKMEDDLDRVESAEIGSLEILTRFYSPFKKQLDAASEGMLSIKGIGFPTGLQCPECGKALHIKVGKNGHFLACCGYPDCRYSRNYTRNEKGMIQPVEPSAEETTGEECEKCGKPMIKKH